MDSSGGGEARPRARGQRGGARGQDPRIRSQAWAASLAHVFSLHFLEPNDYHLLSRSCHTISNGRFLRNIMAEERIYDSPAPIEQGENSHPFAK